MDEMLARNFMLLTILAGCGSTINMPAPVAYTSSCASGDSACERRLNAQTLYYINEKDAAQMLMCEDNKVAEAIGEVCGVTQ